MATPAASAFHRRRHILVTPKERTQSISEARPLTSNRSDDLLRQRSAARPSDIRRSNRESRNWFSVDAAEPNPALLAKAPPRNVWHESSFMSGLRRYAQNSALKAGTIATLCLFVGRWLLSLADVLGTFLMRDESYPEYDIGPPFIVLFFFKSVAMFLYSLALLAIHFLLSRPSSASPSFKMSNNRLVNLILGSVFTRSRLLHIVCCVSACVLQSCLLAYIIYGPLVTPVSLCGKRCMLETGGANSWGVLPSWIDLTPHTNTAMLAGFVFSVFWYASGADAGVSIPFRISSVRWLRLQIPRLILLAGVPMLVVAAPAIWMQLAFSESRRGIAEDTTLYWLAIELFAKIYAALSTSALTLLSWSAFSILAGQGHTMTSDWNSGGQVDKLSVQQPAFMHAKRAQFLELIKVAGDLRRGNSFDNRIDFDIIEALDGLLRFDKDAEGFPGFDDATGQVWRETLFTCLYPLDQLCGSLRDYNLRQSQTADGGITKSGSLFIRPTTRPQLISSPHLDSFGTMSISQERLLVAGTRIMSDLFVASYDQDCYGVVQRTLPHATRSLLKCKEQTTAFLQSRDEMGAPNASGSETSLASRLKQAMRLRNDYDSITAIDDALTLSMYHIVGKFRSHLFGYLDGMEVDWDHSLDKILESFLDYHIP